MRGIPKEAQPSSLLWKEEMCQSARELRENCCRFTATDRRLLEKWVRDAEQLLFSAQPNDYAIILICLADRYHRLDMFSRALDLAKKAEGCFCPYPETKHQHNCAVALYAIGLAYQRLDDEVNALRYYDKAIEEFKKTKDMWKREHEKGMISQCDIARHWLRELREHLMNARTRWRPHDKVPLPVFPPIAAGEPIPLADENWSEWIDVDVEDANRANFALEVKGNSMIEADIHNGDLALIEQRHDWPDRPGQIVAVIIKGIDDDKTTLKKTYRAEDHIRLEPANETYPFIIIPTPSSLSKSSIRSRYTHSHPRRFLEFRLAQEVQIAGWYRGKVPKGIAP